MEWWKLGWCLPLVAASCGLPVEEIRSAAEKGDVEKAIRLARGELEGFRAAAFGTLDRLADRADARNAVLGTLGHAPVTALPLLEEWAEAESGMDEGLRTFARARISELEGGAWENELQVALGSATAEVRAYALRGLLPVGVAPPLLVEKLGDPDPRVTAEAARGLARAAREGGGLHEAYRAAVREHFADGADDVTRNNLAGALDPKSPEDLAALVAALADRDSALAVAAARTLARLDEPLSVPEVAALIEGPTSAAGLTIALAPGGRIDTAVRNAYVERVFEETEADAPRRLNAIWGLPEDDWSLEFLTYVLDGGATNERVAACERLTFAERETDRCRALLTAIATSGEDMKAALDAAEILWELGEDAAAEWLRSFARSDDPQVRRRVMMIAAARRFDPDIVAAGLADPHPDVAAAAAIAALRVPDPFERPGVAP